MEPVLHLLTTSHDVFKCELHPTETNSWNQMSVSSNRAKMQWSLLLVMGQCYFISCQLYQYHYVEDTKTWTEAQEYCREHYTDLATVSNMTDIKRLLEESTGNQTEAWIGLNNRADVTRTWHWSLPGVEFKDDGTRWDDGQPNHVGNVENCVITRKQGKWHDFPCPDKKPFLCYNESGSTKIHLINEKKNWTDAQKYCRDHHTDLVSGLNQLDQVDEVKLTHDTAYWIGLFRDTWRWSDGSSSSFRHWDQTLSSGDECAVTMLNEEQGRWKNADCTDQKPFFCYDDNVILIKESKTWEEALNYCRDNYNDLVSITNLDEQRWVQERAKKASTPFVWLGLRYSCFLDFWFWVSDEVVSYKNWASDGKNDDCDMSGAMDTGGKHQWVKTIDNKEFNFICSNS
ncbi:C-type mannose receptor 2-like [Mugil cephalus]|uniref:C-type mannose receptor 2-like n=1 Tax=Mugil cephalus TaxID=48193 RepID=UPI001FB5A153|nr:C-type mannose receptor 2-like [Mugil cephalus]